MNNRMDEARQAFTADSINLLGQMEDALQSMAQQADDDVALDAAFWAAHTIKGAARCLGLHGIVAFTHVAENVLDKARQGSIRFDATLAELMFAVVKHIRALLESGPTPDYVCRVQGEALIVRLAAVLLAHSPSPAKAATPNAEPTKIPSPPGHTAHAGGTPAIHA